MKLLTTILLLSSVAFATHTPFKVGDEVRLKKWGPKYQDWCIDNVVWRQHYGGYQGSLSQVLKRVPISTHRNGFSYTAVPVPCSQLKDK